jgi:hypothetical protein
MEMFRKEGFFFEKKKQKTFVPLGMRCPTGYANTQKFFGAFFQKRTASLS